MITETIPYTNPFNGREEEMTAYFHLNKNDIAMLTAEANDAGHEDLDKQLQAIIQSGKNVAIFNFFKQLILRAYGKRQGSEFKKSPAISEEFESHEAFSEFVWSLMSDEARLGKFFAQLVNGPAFRAPLLNETKEGAVNSDSKLTDDEQREFEAWRAERLAAQSDSNIFAQEQPDPGLVVNDVSGTESATMFDPDAVTSDAQHANPFPDPVTPQDVQDHDTRPRKLTRIELDRLTFSEVQAGVEAGRWRVD